MASSHLLDDGLAPGLTPELLVVLDDMILTETGRQQASPLAIRHHAVGGQYGGQTKKAERDRAAIWQGSFSERREVKHLSRETDAWTNIPTSV